MSDSTIAKMIKELKDKIEELEQQLAELSEKYIQVEALAAQYALEAGKVDLIDLMKELQSPALVNKMKAEAVREAVEFKFTEKEIDIAMPQSEWVEEEDYRRFGWNSCCSAMMAYAKQLEEGE